MDKFIERGHARRAGGVENYFCILQRQRIYKNFVLIGRFNEPISKDLISYALRKLLLSYPILACSIVTTDYSDLTVPRPDHDYVKVMDMITLQDVMMDLPQEIVNCKDTEQQLKLLNDITWEYGDETPLWKLAMLDDRTLCYISNHILSDGTTAKNLFDKLQQLFNEYDPSSTELPPYIVDYSADFQSIPPLPTAIDGLLNYTPPLSFLPGYLLNVLTIRTLCFKGKTSTRDDTHSYRVIRVDSKHVESIRKKLKEHNVTLTPYLLTAALNAMYTNVLKDTWLGLMDVVIPCNSRQFLPDNKRLQDSQLFGSITAGSHLWYPPLKQLSWANINYTNGIFQYCRAARHYLYGMGILFTDFMTKRTNLDKLIGDATMNQTRGGLNFSNIGVIPQYPSEKYSLEDVIFAKNSHGTINAFSLSACSTSNGQTLVFTMADGTVPKEKFDQIATTLEANILSFA